MWNLYTKGVTYISTKESEAVGKLQVPLGQVTASPIRLDDILSLSMLLQLLSCSLWMNSKFLDPEVVHAC